MRMYIEIVYNLLTMKHFFCKLFVVVIVLIASAYELGAKGETVSDGKEHLGKISVYRFTFKDLSYQDHQKVERTAVGTEYTGELFVAGTGSNVVFSVSVGGEEYVVYPNPYGNKVSNEEYYSAWLLKDGKYESLPKLTHKAGDYFLALPNYNTESSTPPSRSTNKSNQKSSQSISNSGKDQSRSELRWETVGKVRAYKSQTIIQSGGEQDVKEEYDLAYLYSAFDGEKVRYKIHVPSTGSTYEASQNGFYTGEKIRYSRNGKRVEFLPSLQRRFTHVAGPYYFSPENLVSW